MNHVNPNKIDVLNQHLEPSNWNASSGETIGPKIEETTDDFGFLPIVLVQNHGTLDWRNSRIHKFLHGAKKVGQLQLSLPLRVNGIFFLICSHLFQKIAGPWQFS